MTRNSEESVVFVVGGAAVGASVSSAVGGIGLVGGFGGISLGIGTMAGVGAVAGAASYGAFRAIETGDPNALGAVGVGAIAGASVSSAIGGMGLGVGGTAFGIGMGSMAAAGGIVGLGIYGLAKMLDDTNKESASQSFARMEATILAQEAYTQALLELDPVLAEFNWKQKFAALEVEEELHKLKAEIQSQHSFNLNTTNFDDSKLPSEPERKNLEPQIENTQIDVLPPETWKCLTTLRHTASVNSLAINPQSNIIASASDDKTVTLWNLQTGKQLFTFFGSAEVYAVAISPDGKTIIAGDFDNKITSWQLQTKAYNCTFSSQSGSPDSHASLVYALAFSPDGKAIASGSADRTVKLWHRNGIIKRTLKGHTDAVCAVAFSPDGQILASGSADRTIRLWKITSQEQPRLLNGHSGWITSVAISPDGKLLVSASTDSTVNIWDLATGELLNTLTGHSAGVWSVAISPDATILASGSNDGTVKLWDLETGRLFCTLAGKNPVAFSPDGKFLCTGNGNTIKICQLVPETELEPTFAGDWWEVLGVTQNATFVQVKSAYRNLVKQNHPDVNPSARAKVNIQIINQAYRQFRQERAS